MPPKTGQDSLDQEQTLEEDLEQARPKEPLPRSALVLWLVVASLAVFAVPMLLFAQGVRGNVLRTREEVQLAQATLAAARAPAPELRDLVEALSRLQQDTAGLKSAQATIAAGHIDWSAVMGAIGDYDRNQLAIAAVQQAERRLTLKGRAVDDKAVTYYVGNLERSGLFSRVVIQSMKLVDVAFTTPTATQAISLQATLTPVPSPALTPTATLSPTLAPSATPDPRDPFEPDDLQPRDTFPGETQTHSFYPLFDVDLLRFLAKAGRYYRITTSSLAPGVDTHLTLSLGDMTLTNDDRQPGDPSSEISFRSGLAYDSDAVIRVANRGQYGPDKTYQITIAEILPTATPVTATLPTATPVPTAEQRDGFEPDDTTPRPIALGETQTHNFHPAKDLDKVQFLAKSGRRYRVWTSSLASGVDTFLVAIVGNATYTNDDRPGAGSNDQSSELIFAVPAGPDQTAVVTVANRGQDGPDKTYQLSVEELVAASATPTAPPTPTQTPTATSTPTTAPSPTVDLRDKLEPDETPPPISLGEIQARNFYPQGDMDRARFLAKAGRTYRLQTSNLALGVDTILTVTMGITVCVNDDRVPGDLSSDVTCRTPDGGDVEALVVVANRGQFGPDKSYQLSLMEVTASAPAGGGAGLVLVAFRPAVPQAGWNRRSSPRGPSLAEGVGAPRSAGLWGPPGAPRQAPGRAVEFVILVEIRGRP